MRSVHNKQLFPKKIDYQHVILSYILSSMQIKIMMSHYIYIQCDVIARATKPVTTHTIQLNNTSYGT